MVITQGPRFLRSIDEFSTMIVLKVKFHLLRGHESVGTLFESILAGDTWRAAALKRQILAPFVKLGMVHMQGDL